MSKRKLEITWRVSAALKSLGEADWRQEPRASRFDDAVWRFMRTHGLATADRNGIAWLAPRGRRLLLQLETAQ